MTYISCPTCKAHIASDRHCAYCGTYRVRVNGVLETRVITGRIVASGLRSVTQLIERAQKAGTV